MAAAQHHKFLNASTSAVTELLEGFVQSHPGVCFLDGFPDVKVVVRAQLDKTKVALISGKSWVFGARSTPAGGLANERRR